MQTRPISGTTTAADQVEELQKALHLHGPKPDIMFALANALVAAENFEAAARCFKALLQVPLLSPEMTFNTWSGLAVLRQRQGHLVNAAAAYWHALAIRRDSRASRAAFAKVLKALGRPAGARLIRDKVPPKAPAAARGHLELGITLVEAGMFEQATQQFETASQATADPIRGEAIGALAELDAMADRHDEAISGFKAAIAILGETAPLMAALGASLTVLGKQEKAESALRRAIELDPNHTDARKNLANLHLEIGDAVSALAACDAAIETAPDLPAAHNNRANILLLLGRYAEGWSAYEWRRRMPGAPPAVALAEWDGSPLSGRRLHVIGEQAAGDAVMFGTCVSDLKHLGGDVVLHLEQRITKLFADAFPWATIDNRLPYSAPDAVAVPLGSLPKFLRTSETDFNLSQPYLVADKAAVSRWRQRYSELGDGPKIGFSWRGGKSLVQRRLRGLQLGDWAPVLSQKEFVFVDLQYGDQDTERDALRTGTGIEVYRPIDSDPVADLDGFAAQVAALDYVISIDNTTVHFAGALGVPTLTLVPQNPSWRWQLERTDSPWYPSMTLLRQQHGEDWERVLGRVAEHLRSSPPRSLFDPR